MHFFGTTFKERHRITVYLSEHRSQIEENRDRVYRECIYVLVASRTTPTSEKRKLIRSLPYGMLDLFATSDNTKGVAHWISQPKHLLPQSNP